MLPLQQGSPPPANATSQQSARSQRIMFNSLNMLAKDVKDEQFQIKTARTFFQLQNMVSRQPWINSGRNFASSRVSV